VQQRQLPSYVFINAKIGIVGALVKKKFRRVIFTIIIFSGMVVFSSGQNLARV
jgi:hypothetical protein